MAKPAFQWPLLGHAPLPRENSTPKGHRSHVSMASSRPCPAATRRTQVRPREDRNVSMASSRPCPAATFGTVMSHHRGGSSFNGLFSAMPRCHLLGGLCHGPPFPRFNGLFSAMPRCHDVIGPVVVKTFQMRFNGLFSAMPRCHVEDEYAQAADSESFNGLF